MKNKTKKIKVIEKNNLELVIKDILNIIPPLEVYKGVDLGDKLILNSLTYSNEKWNDLYVVYKENKIKKINKLIKKINKIKVQIQKILYGTILSNNKKKEI
jgi:hypothetical protein